MYTHYIYKYETYKVQFQPNFDKQNYTLEAVRHQQSKVSAR